MRNPWLLMADGEYYRPLRSGPEDPGALAPSRPADGWISRRDGLWCSWSPADAAASIAAQGWKVHVSATPERLGAVLDVVARACFEAGIVFKHLGTRDFFLLLHQKHAERVQAGKFCAMYPPDVEAARALMTRLEAELADERGTYILTDRRFGSSAVVHYRYGSFVGHERLRADGTVERLVRDGDGVEVPDVRRPSFVLPPGIIDPFVPPKPAVPTKPAGPAGPATRTASASGGGPAPAVLLGGRFAIEAAIRHSNGGGAYQGRDTETGAAVFVKEARAYNGYTSESHDSRERLRREYRTLTEIHAREPGLCPEPLGYFTRWEHEFLVTEFVEGVGLLTWYAAHQPLAEWDTGADRRRAYYDDVEALLASLDDALARLHAIGLRFGDVSHGNVIVQPGNRIRLIDFETAAALDEPPTGLGTAGYLPPPKLREAGVDADDYGAAALAMLLLFPLAHPLQLDPAGRLALHRRDLDRNLPVPEGLWKRATRYYAAEGPAPDESEHPWPLPTVHELDDDPENALRMLGEGLVAGILAMARPERPGWLFPVAPEGYTTNTVCFAHGAAGVLHGLKRWGVAIPPEFVRRFRGDALAAAARLAPGFQAGLAGIGVVLAESGLPTEASDLLRAAERHPLVDRSVLLGHGAAGIGLANLRVHASTGDPERLEAAARIAERLLARGLEPIFQQAGTAGLEQGLSGVALFLAELGHATGAARYAAAALRLIHAELDRGQEHEGAIRFLDAGDRRTITYLSIGSAGVATALGRIAALTGDERCRRTQPRVLSLCRATSSMEPGLYTGHAGWAYALAEHAHHTRDATAREFAVRVAGSLTKYAVRFPGGLRTLAPFEHRFHCDLATGDAGVLLALAHVLGRATDPVDPARADGQPSTRKEVTAWSP